MNESFKCAFFKRWTVLDDRIVVGKKEFLFTEIAKIDIDLPTGAAGDGIVYLYANDKKMSLYYSGRDTKRASAAVDFVIDAMQPEGSKVPHEFRKKCAVCGFVFCYTRDDLRNNKKYLEQAANAEAGAATSNLFTGNGAQVLSKKMDAEEARSKYRDFSRCPKCNSADLVDATDADFEEKKEPASDNNFADDLLKLKNLLDMGVITQEDFDQKKKQILGL